MIDLSGKVALVTGASRGIGRGIALALAEAGADVAVNYREQAAAAEAVCEAITALGRRAVAVQADVSQAEPVEALVRRTTEALGPADILVNNAGQAIYRTLDELTLADWEHALRVNLKSAWLVTRAALPPMRERRWGRIVNITSGASRTGGVVGVHYTASKAAMEGMTRAYAMRLVKEGVTVNAVAPALIHTDMLRDPEERAKRIPMGRLGTVEECGTAVLSCVAMEYMTGQTLHLNGGLYFR